MIIFIPKDICARRRKMPAGYDDNSPINFTDKIKGKYLIIHGTADDNVHFQNATQMIISAGKKQY